MRKISISSLPINICWILRSLALIWILTILYENQAMAQGRSIPTSSAVQEQRESSNLAALDELPEGVKYRYPLLNGMSVSFNIFPPVLNMFGSQFGSYEGALTLDLHHRFFPQGTAGVGFCNETNDNGVKYECPALPFFKAGMLYNFNYNDLKPNDFYGALIRFGYAYSKSDISNLSYTDGLWNKIDDISIDNLEAHSVWMELGGFIKVQVIDHVSLGWDITFKPFLHKGKTGHGEPYYVPGYGKTASKIGFGFHVYYDIWQK